MKTSLRGFVAKLETMTPMKALSLIDTIIVETDEHQKTVDILTTAYGQRGRKRRTWGAAINDPLLLEKLGLKDDE